jgi:adenine-specific DNA-methyltransferase
VLKHHRFLVSFCGYSQTEKFLLAWKAAGFYPLEHFVYVKSYASSFRYAKRMHEQVYLLGKGFPYVPKLLLPDVLAWRYTGDVLHPTQKPLSALKPFIAAFSRPDDIVLDPFAGSGTTAVAAKQLGRRHIGIEISPAYAFIAMRRLHTGFA